MKKSMKLIALVLGMAVGFVSCASTTVISTTDSDAKIFVNGEYRGKGQITYSDTKIIGANNIVKIKKEGCEPVVHTFSRDEKFSVAACIGGVLVLIPFLWIMGYNSTHTYEYECEAN